MRPSRARRGCGAATSAAARAKATDRSGVTGSPAAWSERPSATAAKRRIAREGTGERRGARRRASRQSTAASPRLIGRPPRVAKRLAGRARAPAPRGRPTSALEPGRAHGLLVLAVLEHRAERAVGGLGVEPLRAEQLERGDPVDRPRRSPAASARRRPAAAPARRPRRAARRAEVPGTRRRTISTSRAGDG